MPEIAQRLVSYPVQEKRLHLCLILGRKVQMLDALKNLFHDVAGSVELWIDLYVVKHELPQMRLDDIARRGPAFLYKVVKIRPVRTKSLRRAFPVLELVRRLSPQPESTMDLIVQREAVFFQLPNSVDVASRCPSGPSELLTQ